MEFWAGVVGASATIWLGAGRRRLTALERAGEIAPVALCGYAVYEAACLLRDGCFGPASPVGLRPGGLGDAQLPVGLLVGAATAALGTVAWRWSRRRRPDAVVVLALTGLAGIRSAAGFALPKLASGLTRPHIESLLAFGIGLLCSLRMCRRGRDRTIPRSPAPGPQEADRADTRGPVQGLSSDSM